jgi:hypothetical protein
LIGSSTNFAPPTIAAQQRNPEGVALDQRGLEVILDQQYMH